MRCSLQKSLFGRGWVGLVLLTGLSGPQGWADETFTGPGKKTVIVQGEVRHYKTPAEFLKRFGGESTVYGEEIVGPRFEVVVEGLSAGRYKIEIDEIEVYHEREGGRLLDINCKDTPLAKSLDLFAEVEARGIPHLVSGTVDHQGDAIRGPLKIEFKAVKGEAKFNAIRIFDETGSLMAEARASDLESREDVAAKVIPDIKEPAIYQDAGQQMCARIDDLIRRMSLWEKAHQLMNAAPGIPRLNVPPYDYWSEGLHGVARNGLATVFPQAIGLAATWDEELLEKIGDVIAEEGRAKYEEAIRRGEPGRENQGLTFWAPNINIFRDPRWGRGQETYGEDPLLTARLGVRYVRGMQGDDPVYYKAVACAKHFAVHSGPEAGRGGFDAAPPKYDLYNTYLPQFQALVEEGKVGIIMSAYNALYGVPCSADPWLLTKLLRDTWGFRGHVVSDCGAVGNITGQHHFTKSNVEGVAKALRAGLDLECGGTMRVLPKAVDEGLITEAEVDQALHRVLEARFRLGLFDPPGCAPFSGIPLDRVENADHLALALRAARESMVLLTNDGTLPLDHKKLKMIAVIGPNANDKQMLYGNYHGVASHPVTILEGIRKAAGDFNKVIYAQGCDLVVDKADADRLRREAVDAAHEADLIVFVGGLTAGIEGEEMSLELPGFHRGDRTEIELPAAQRLTLKALKDTGKPVVFVNCSGSAIAMPWEAKNLNAILQAWYPGVEGGTAVADVLFGEYNPSGRLPVTFYRKTSDLPSFEDYSMANRTYRYFRGEPLFSFGAGLSYSKFEYGVPRCQVNERYLEVIISVKNTSDRDGTEVVQIYAGGTSKIPGAPIRTLIGFQRVPLSSGRSEMVALRIPLVRLRLWDEASQSYQIRPGSYALEIGASSQDIRQKVEFTLS